MKMAVILKMPMKSNPANDLDNDENGNDLGNANEK